MITVQKGHFICSDRNKENISLVRQTSENFNLLVHQKLYYLKKLAN